MDMEQIAIPFNRRWLWGVFLWLFVHSVIFIFLLPLMFCSVFRNIPKLSAPMHVLSALELPILTVAVLFLFYLTAGVGRYLWNKTPACVFTPEGIVDNSSGLFLGQVRWDEMKQIYPADIPNNSRWLKLKYRAVVILFKDLSQISPRLPYWKRLSLRMEPNRNFVCIYQYLLGITADEFMKQLNDYYRARVTNGV